MAETEHALLRDAARLATSNPVPIGECGDALEEHDSNNTGAGWGAGGDFTASYQI